MPVFSHDSPSLHSGGVLHLAAPAMHLIQMRINTQSTLQKRPNSSSTGCNITMRLAENGSAEVLAVCQKRRQTDSLKGSERG